MELFRNPTIDWLSKKWYFLAFSLIFSVSGLFSLLFWHHLPLDVDFKGGTVVRVRFDATPDLGKIRSAVERAGVRSPSVTQIGAASANEVQITVSLAQTSENALDKSRATVIDALTKYYSSTGPSAGNKLDLDNAGRGTIENALEQANPEHLTPGDDAHAKYLEQAEAILRVRDGQHDGLLPSITTLNGAADAPVVAYLEQNGYLSGFNERGVESVGPQVGAELKKQAILATIYSLIGMLIYLWFRFELIYGVAAVVAVFHDTLITIGAFSLANQEVSLTVVAAILTLIGYSMNDTIVVFDRIRENLRQSRRESLPDLVNRSINQTLSRTVLTSGLTFLTVLSLLLFGGAVLRGFSFALTVGILIGTYSSIAVAAPMLVAWQQRKGGAAASLPAARRAAR